MAFDKTQLTKVGNLHSVSGAATSRQHFMYFTTDTIAQVAAAGYFNDVRGYLFAGDVIQVLAANGNAMIQLATVPKTGNVTVTNLSGAGSRRVANGVHTTVTASDTLVTGLTKVDVIIATLADDPVAGMQEVTATIGDQNGAPASGSVLIKGWKPTAANDTTRIAATTFGKKVNWVAYGS